MIASKSIEFVFYDSHRVAELDPLFPHRSNMEKCQGAYTYQIILEKEQAGRVRTVLSGSGFSGPEWLDVPAEGMASYPLTFRPTLQCVVTVTIAPPPILLNRSSCHHNIFISPRPLSKETDVSGIIYVFSNNKKKS